MRLDSAKQFISVTNILMFNGLDRTGRGKGVDRGVKDKGGVSNMKDSLQ